MQSQYKVNTKNTKNNNILKHVLNVLCSDPFVPTYSTYVQTSHCYLKQIWPDNKTSACGVDLLSRAFSIPEQIYCIMSSSHHPSFPLFSDTISQAWGASLVVLQINFHVVKCEIHVTYSVWLPYNHGNLTQPDNVLSLCLAQP